ncbi:MAG: hypothetical protein M0C28_33730 [Candidatus Moduliflexus flocculans]|nr:hypothetical protein [Candidatus Moduliflexus flocculans]
MTALAAVRAMTQVSPLNSRASQVGRKPLAMSRSRTSAPQPKPAWRMVLVVVA